MWDVLRILPASAAFSLVWYTFLAVFLGLLGIPQAATWRNTIGHGLLLTFFATLPARPYDGPDGFWYPREVAFALFSFLLPVYVYVVQPLQACIYRRCRRIRCFATWVHVALTFLLTLPVILAAYPLLSFGLFYASVVVEPHILSLYDQEMQVEPSTIYAPAEVLCRGTEALMALQPMYDVAVTHALYYCGSRQVLSLIDPQGFSSLPDLSISVSVCGPTASASPVNFAHTRPALSRPEDHPNLRALTFQLHGQLVDFMLWNTRVVNLHTKLLKLGDALHAAPALPPRTADLFILPADFQSKLDMSKTLPRSIGNGYLAVRRNLQTLFAGSWKAWQMTMADVAVEDVRESMEDVVQELALLLKALPDALECCLNLGEKAPERFRAALPLLKLPPVPSGGWLHDWFYEKQSAYSRAQENPDFLLYNSTRFAILSNVDLETAHTQTAFHELVTALYGWGAEMQFYLPDSWAGRCMGPEALIERQRELARLISSSSSPDEMVAAGSQMWSIAVLDGMRMGQGSMASDFAQLSRAWASEARIYESRNGKKTSDWRASLVTLRGLERRVGTAWWIRGWVEQ